MLYTSRICAIFSLSQSQVLNDVKICGIASGAAPRGWSIAIIIRLGDPVFVALFYNRIVIAICAVWTKWHMFFSSNVVFDSSLDSEWIITVGSGLYVGWCTNCHSLFGCLRWAVDRLPQSDWWIGRASRRFIVRQLCCLFFYCVILIPCYANVRSQ